MTIISRTGLRYGGVGLTLPLGCSVSWLVCSEYEPKELPEFDGSEFPGGDFENLYPQIA